MSFKILGWSISQWVVAGVAAVHCVIMLGEMFPLDEPFVMNAVIEDWAKPIQFKRSDGDNSKFKCNGCEIDKESSTENAVERSNDRQFVATIVQNAAIYNGIVAACLIASAFKKDYAVQLTLLLGVIVAGVFGVSLNAKTLIQAAIGVIGLIVVVAEKRRQPVCDEAPVDM